MNVRRHAGARLPQRKSEPRRDEDRPPRRVRLHDRHQARAEGRRPEEARVRGQRRSPVSRRVIYFSHSEQQQRRKHHDYRDCNLGVPGYNLT